MLGAVFGIIALLVAVIVCNLENFFFIGTVLLFHFFLAIFFLTVSLICCFVISFSVIDSDVVLTHNGASFSLFLASLTRLFFFSPSLLGGL